MTRQYRTVSSNCLDFCIWLPQYLQTKLPSTCFTWLPLPPPAPAVAASSEPSKTNLWAIASCKRKPDGRIVCQNEGRFRKKPSRFGYELPYLSRRKEKVESMPWSPNPASQKRSGAAERSHLNPGLPSVASASAFLEFSRKQGWLTASSKGTWWQMSCHDPVSAMLSSTTASTAANRQPFPAARDKKNTTTHRHT